MSSLAKKEKEEQKRSFLLSFLFPPKGGMWQGWREKGVESWGEERGDVRRAV